MSGESGIVSGEEDLMRTIICLVTVYLIISLISVSAESVQVVSETEVRNQDIIKTFKQFDWKLRPDDRPSIKLVTKEQIFQLAKEMLNWKDFEIPRISVDEFVVKDINNDGRYEVVATIDTTCTVCPNLVIIIANLNNRIILFEIPDEYASLENDVVDLDRNGTYEILSKSPLSTETIAGPEYMPWVDIYEWNENKYVKSNKKFVDYYKNVYIPKQETSIKELESLMRSVQEGTVQDAQEKEKEIVRIRNRIQSHEQAIAKAREEILQSQR